MKAFLKICLLPLLCLLSLSASSQVRPHVVKLDSGLILRRPLVGLDTAYYRRARLSYYANAQLLDVRAGRIAALTKAGQLSDSLALATAAELRRCRSESAAREADFAKLTTQTRAVLAQPPERPMLLNPNFYKGVGVGAVALFVLKLYFHL